jgi:proline racemase
MSPGGPEENPSLSVSATDYHTAGEPFRIVGAGGVGNIPGDTVLDKRDWAASSGRRRSPGFRPW